MIVMSWEKWYCAQWPNKMHFIRLILINLYFFKYAHFDKEYQMYFCIHSFIFRDAYGVVVTNCVFNGNIMQLNICQDRAEPTLLCLLQTAAHRNDV